MPLDQARIQAASTLYPKPRGFCPSYGTAGFRGDAELLPSTLFSCGILAGLRSRASGMPTGAMITASHNPEQDNGVKLVEPMGGMLIRSWEAHAARLACCAQPSEFFRVLQSIVDSEGITKDREGCVWLAYDRRKSSFGLAGAFKAGVEALGCTVVDCGVQTTPQLHWRVRAHNCGQPDSEDAYFSSLLSGFKVLVEGTQPLPSPLYVDCSGGVGFQSCCRLVQELPLDARVLNGPDQEGVTLNKDCGSDYVLNSRQLPVSFQDVPVGARCCSLDGDADRLLYFMPRSGGGVKVLDGDKIAALIAEEVAVQLQDVAELFPDPSVAVIQTAYANAAATRHIREKVGLPVECVCTGVKHLHHAAAQHDVSILSEANGHGTVLLSDRFMDAMRAAQDTSAGAAFFVALHSVANQTVGDSLSCILLVEACLRRSALSVADWDARYTAVPSRLRQVPIRDRFLVETAEADTVCTSPAGLQAAMDELVADIPGGRAFVRPSGTEDVLRIYAEADTDEDVERLADQVETVISMLNAV